MSAVYRWVQIQLHRAPLLLPLIALLGALLSLLVASWWYLLLTVVALLLALCWQEWRIFFCSLLVAALGYGHLDGSMREQQRVIEVLLAQETVDLEGYLLRCSESSAILALNGGSVCVELRGKHLVGGLGDYMRCRGKAYPLVEDHLIGTFDRASWLRSQGVCLSVELYECHPSKEGWHLSRLYALSDALRQVAVQHIMPEGTEDDPRRQVLCALLLGERRAAEPATLESFQWSGTLHAFAVSGLHVGLVASLLWGFFLMLRLSPRYAPYLILLCLAAYVFVTGMAVSALRAYLIIFLASVGLMQRRQVMLMNIFCAVALLVLLFAPRQLTQAGFLLSFSVYACICLVAWASRRDTPWFGADAYLPNAVYSFWQERMKAFDLFLRGMLVVSISAYLISLPLMAHYFGSYNTYGVLANLCIAPLLPLCMALGLACFLPYVGAYLLPMALKMAGVLLSLCSFFAGLPNSHPSTTLPRPSSAFVCLGLRFEQSATMLGNPGLIICNADEQTARWSLCPAFGATGQQAALLLQLPRFSKDDGVDYLQRYWPRIKVIDGSAYCYHYGENCYSIYPAEVRMKKPRIRDYFPIIHWRNPKGSLLYLGDASASTFYAWRVKGVDMKADVAIIGYNDKQPIIDVETLQELGVRVIILLPHVPAHLYDEGGCIRVRQLRENEDLQGDLCSELAN